MQMIPKQIATAVLLLPFFLCAGCSGAGEGAEHSIRFADSEAMHAFFRYTDRVPLIVQGHRGTCENGLPESSIAAMEYVLQQMPAIFEIDPRLTKDSVAVVFHDAKLDRTTNGTGCVADYTWEELRQLHLKNAQGEVTEYRIPTLGEVLDWARDRTVLILDKKDVPLPVIARMIREYDANRYVVNMFARGCALLLQGESATDVLRLDPRTGDLRPLHGGGDSSDAALRLHRNRGRRTYAGTLCAYAQARRPLPDGDRLLL